MRLGSSQKARSLVQLAQDYKEMRATAAMLTHETKQRGRTLTTTEVQLIAEGHQLETFDHDTGENLTQTHWRWDAGASMHPSRTVHQLQDVEDALHQQQSRDDRRLETVWGSWRDTEAWHQAYDDPIDYWTEAEWRQQHAWTENAGRDAQPPSSNHQQSKGKGSHDWQSSTYGKGWHQRRY